ncbi:MAG: ABC transporter substrate-binding protein [Bacteroidaceae bacterium]|nr:ABC transporter substrate-binding protein [Bacteroidaceae bacterium]
MKRYILHLTVIILYSVCCCFTAALSSCKNDDGAIEPEQKDAETITLNVDVILPPDIREQWQTSIDMAMDNIAKTQQRMNRKVVLNLRYHDEDKENLDQLGYALTHPEEGADTCHAIIGPYHSSNAADLLKYARQTRLPVVMPTCTSAELQRTNARNTYAWFLTESDITQCEMMLSVAQSLHATDVALIHSDDTYGQSFKDWFAYYATERNLHIAGGTHAWKPGDDLRPFLREIVQQADDAETWVLLALSNAEDYLAVCSAIGQFKLDEVYGTEKVVYLRNICADTSMDRLVLEDENNYDFYLGVTPSGAMNYGFPQAYKGHHYRLPYNGEAQVYDALTIIALGAATRAATPDRCIVDGKQVAYNEKPFGPGLTDYMRAVVSSEEGPTVQWDVAGLTVAFQELSQGRNIYMTGATGNLNFDKDTHTKILNTTYMLWDIAYEYVEATSQTFTSVEPLLYMSTDGSSNEASTTEFWKLEKQWTQRFSNTSVNHNLPAITDRWAVVISPSTTWSNYRHQADAFAVYQGLRHYGYDDDHIVLIVEDNLANDSRNIYPGQIFVERGDNPAKDNPLMNFDVRQNAIVDYHFSNLQPDDLADIMMGRTSQRLPHVIHPTASSNVFFFWSGHGGHREGPLWGNEDAGQYFGTDRIQNIVAQMNEQDMYRRMMFAIETCYSGKWGEALTGLPDVLALTAASPYETSKADMHDRDLGVYLSNAFARTLREEIFKNTSITIYDLYRELARTTTGSHVNIYNQQQYGSVYEETMRDYFQ